MALNNDAVIIALTGDVASYDTSEAAPTSATSARPASATSRGWITEDGIEISEESSQTEIKAWQNENATVRTISTDASCEITLSMLQFDDENLEFWVGSAKKADGSYEFNAGQMGGRFSLDLQLFDTVKGTTTRIYIPECEITSRDALTIVSTDALKLGVTITAYKSVAKGYTYKIWHAATPAS